MLNQLPPDSQPSFLNSTVQERLEEMNLQRQNIRTLTSESFPTLRAASENDVISYFDRMKLQGEYKAMLWLQNRNKLR